MSDAAGRACHAERFPASRARWWWEFHQAVVAIVYAADDLADVDGAGRHRWSGRKRGLRAVLAAAIVAVTLRLHLWFTSRFYPAELEWARARATAWMLAVGLPVRDGRSSPAARWSAMRARCSRSSKSPSPSAPPWRFRSIEPATTRAAFGHAHRL